MIQQIQLVSKHFNYTEEYVMDHSFSWLNRKYKQAQKEQFENHQIKVIEGFQSALLIIDSIFNKGKSFNEILPPSIEEAMKKEIENKSEQSQFVTDIWWNKPSHK